MAEAERTRKSKGETFEGLAFTFCKAATIIALTGRWALPVAAGSAALFYVLADLNGKHDTRCLLMKPRVIAAFWAAVALVALWRTTQYPHLGPPAPLPGITPGAARGNQGAP